MTDDSTAAGYLLCRETLAAMPDAPIIAEVGDNYRMSVTPAWHPAKPHLRLSPTYVDICVSAVSRDGVWGDRVADTITVEFPNRSHVSTILSDDYRAALRTAVEAKLAEIAALETVGGASR